MRYIRCIALGALALAGCGGAGTQEPAADAGPPEGVLLDSARAPLERAHEIEDITAGRKGQLDDEIERSE
jgi:hypothetical protein